MQGCSNIADIAADNSNLSPYILAVGDYKEVEQLFLVTDKKVVLKIKTEDVPLTLMSAFFIYNICYPSGCINFYAFMEVFTFSFDLYKAAPSVRHFVSSLLS